MSYLISRYKGKYRLMCEYCSNNNQFPKKLDDTYEDADVYIDCQKGIRVFYYGRGILTTYVPLLQTGHNIIKQIYALYINPDNVIIESKTSNIGDKEVTKTTYTIKDENQFFKDLNSKESIIFNIEETDSEVLFNFKSSDDEKIIPLLKPKTSAANRSPFSSKNLPKIEYTISENDMEELNKLTSDFTINNGGWLRLNRCTNDFINTLTTKKYTIEDIKNDMAIKMIKGRDYIHSIGKWNDYIKYLQKNL